MNTIDKYKQLVERYFEATTTEEQEERLRDFLTTPQADDAYFDEIKAVLGLTTVLRRRNQQISSYINGKEVTNPQEVLQQMQKTMTETLQDDSEEQSVLLLRDFFATPQQ